MNDELTNPFLDAKTRIQHGDLTLPGGRLRQILRMTKHLCTILSFTILCSGADADQKELTDLRIEVRRQYFHGFPYERAAKLGGTAVPTLLEMLSGETEQKYWSNVIIVLGVIGDERAVKPLIKFLEIERRGELSLEVYDAIIIVPFALGHIAAKGNEDALKYLIENSRPEAWQARQVKWTFNGIEGSLVPRLYSARCMAALGSAANEKALSALQKMSNDQTLDEGLRHAARGGLATAEEIKSKGREKVFGSEKK